ncbi:Rz1-like lysis system protein LysC [Serratia sp. DD3]|uniref:Rz1-like lysis system protein LysC n=1 Tax=Serratia sp. DD3 TaxID=1410619 RepID=UPI001F1BC530|nr:Rz1-like lysis system protein LysC [Serratia sp. DD3]
MQLKTISALLLLPLVLLLSSCSKAPLPPVPQPVVLMPPETVFTPCEKPALQGTTWGDIGSYALQLQTALELCAYRIDVLNLWRSAHPLPFRA